MQKQLMESLRKKLGVLREAQRGLQDDIRANAQLGEEVGRKSSLLLHCKLWSNCLTVGATAGSKHLTEGG